MQYYTDKIKGKGNNEKNLSGRSEFDFIFFFSYCMEDTARVLSLVSSCLKHAGRVELVTPNRIVGEEKVYGFSP
jgi:hypothetical protein